LCAWAGSWKARCCATRALTPSTRHAFVTFVAPSATIAVPLRTLRRPSAVLPNCASVRTQTHTQPLAHMHARRHVHTCTHAREHARTHAREHARTRTRTHTCTHTRTRAHNMRMMRHIGVRCCVPTRQGPLTAGAIRAACARGRDGEASGASSTDGRIRAGDGVSARARAAAQGLCGVFRICSRSSTNRSTTTSSSKRTCECRTARANP
jgi:hypothetical protein